MDRPLEDDTIDDFEADCGHTSLHADTIVDSGIEIASLTHPGFARSNNEDNYVVLRRTRAAEVLSTSLPPDEVPTDQRLQAWVLAIADGLGGHASGEIASSVAIRTIVNVTNSVGSWIMQLEQAQDPLHLQQRIERYAIGIQQALNEMAAADPRLAGMATTMTAIYLIKDHAIVINVGDSRSYLVRNCRLQQLTRDHTLAQNMQDSGISEATTAPFRNMVTRTFNTDGLAVDFDLIHVPLKQGDRLMLCSDGLTDMVVDQTIGQLMEGADSACQSCEQLAQQALANGGRDNVTLIVAHV